MSEYDNCLHSIWEKGRLLAVALKRESVRTFNSQEIANLLCIAILCTVQCQINQKEQKNQLPYINTSIHGRKLYVYHT